MIISYVKLIKKSFQETTSEKKKSIFNTRSHFQKNWMQHKAHFEQTSTVIEHVSLCLHIRCF